MFTFYYCCYPTNMYMYDVANKYTCTLLYSTIKNIINIFYHRFVLASLYLFQNISFK